MLCSAQLGCVLWAHFRQRTANLSNRRRAMQLKVDVAETHGELVSCKRALARFREREQLYKDKVASLRSQIQAAEAAAHTPPTNRSVTARAASAMSSAAARMGAFPSMMGGGDSSSSEEETSSEEDDMDDGGHHHA